MNRVEITNLKKRFLNQVLFDNFNLSIEKGEFVAIQGASGVGKSTLLNIIGSLDRDYEGIVRVDGIDIKMLSEKKLNEFRRGRVGFVFQFHYLIKNLTNLENILLPCKGDRGEVLKLARELGIENILHKRPNDCSGGECQRVAVARALINNPSIILADEPTGNLDKKNSLILADLVKRLNTEHKRTIILATHDEDIAKYADRIIKL